MNTKKVIKGKSDKTLSYGILSLSLALIFLSFFLLIKSDTVNFLTKSEEPLNPEGSSFAYPEEFLQSESSSKKTYVDEELGYSISYLPLLEPRSIANDNYLSLIIFFVPEGVSGDGFAISVRQDSLEEEKDKIKVEIESETEIAKIEETLIEKNGYQGIKLIFEPKDTINFEKRSVAIFNNGKFSYSLSATTDFIEEVIGDFKILN